MLELDELDEAKELEELDDDPPEVEEEPSEVDDDPPEVEDELRPSGQLSAHFDAMPGHCCTSRAWQTLQRP